LELSENHNNNFRVVIQCAQQTKRYSADRKSDCIDETSLQPVKSPAIYPEDMIVTINDHYIENGSLDITNHVIAGLNVVNINIYLREPEFTLGIILKVCLVRFNDSRIHRQRHVGRQGFVPLKRPLSPEYDLE
jgi:hypothetical protein